MKPAYSVVEANGQDIQSVKVFPDQDTAVAHAIALARGNQADFTDEHLTRIFEDDGYWDQGEWRISVVSIANSGDGEVIDRRIALIDQLRAEGKTDLEVGCAVGAFDQANPTSGSDDEDVQRGRFANDADLVAHYFNMYTDALRTQLAAKEAAFEAAGGRGVELADEIDAMRRALQLRG